MTPIFQLRLDINIAELYEAIAHRIAKIQSLINIALHEQIFEGDGLDQQHYLWVVQGLVEETQTISHALLDRLQAEGA